MVYKQANNTKTNKQKIKQGMIVRTAILYIISVNVPEDYSLLHYTIVDIQQDHSIRHCTPSLSVSHKLFPTTLYTVTVRVQQVHSLLHCTQSLSMSNNTIPFYTVHSHCQCPTRPFQATQYKVKHCQCPTRPFPTTQYKVTVCVQQDNSPLHCTLCQCPITPFPITSYTLSLCPTTKTPYYTVHNHCLCLTTPFQSV